VSDSRHDFRTASDVVDALRETEGAEWVHLWRLLQQRDDAAPQIAAVIRDAPADLRRTALHTLIEPRSPQVVEVLVDLLADERRPIRRLAATRLGESGDPAAVGPLVSVVRSREPPDVRAAAIRALARLGDRRASEVIASALRDRDAGLRQTAAEALYELRDPAAESALRAALEDESRAVHEWSARALDRIFGGSAVRQDDVPQPDLSVLGDWYSDPLIHATSQIYTFRKNGSGEVEQFSMGVVNDRNWFSYQQRDDLLELCFGEDGHRASTRFRLEPGTFRHPYRGEIPCSVLTFVREPYFTSFGPQEHVTYYRLLED
jgi:HEAT repeat protein